MDASQYHSNSMNSNNSPYPSLSNIAPHQLQHNSNIPPHTLPPLQPQHAAMQQTMYSSAPHTPRTPATPNTPGSANLGNFPQMATQSRNYQMMPTNNYQQPPQQYRTSSSMMPQSSTAMTHPQPIAPAPTQNRIPQALRPMPPNGLQHMQSALSSPYGQQSMIPQSSMLENMEPPTHVVGSQGRRGILPSAPGRPAVTATGTGSTKNTMIPAKDADGKFPCPHCTKTYLHAKHLKRHLLRHTGDRPYMCVLCRDTFSRSDILKRHFQKCSIRRGNPNGVSHLSHAQAHLKKSHPGPHKSTPLMSNENDLMGANGMNSMTDPALQHPFGVIPDGSVPDAGSNLTGEQAEALSRANSLKRLSIGGGGRDRRSLAGPGPGGSNRASFDQSYAGGLPSTMPPGMNPSLAFNMPNGQNGHSYSQNYDFASNGSSIPPSVAELQNISSARTHALPIFTGSANSDPQLWSQLFQPTTQDGFMNTYNSNLSTSQLSVKAEPNSNALFTGVYPSIGFSQNMDVPNWNFQNDPVEQISGRLIRFCFPTTIQMSSRTVGIRNNLSADNIKHFLDHYTSFQGHFPVIHMPTFRMAEAYDGLLLGMICIGAVYSERITPTQVRDMMEHVKTVIERESNVYATISREHDNNGYGNKTIGSNNLELEEISAIFMMQVLFTWHGTPVQREKARREFPLIISLAKRAGLTQPMTAAPLSVLHQPNVSVEHFNVASFDWNAWVEQEKRSRLLYTIFLIDAAMALYFNVEPLFNSYEIHIPLPADDAAWDASTSMQCAEALGLHGPLAARDRNHEGSRRAKQPEMHSALKALMHDVYDLQPQTTNLYSKFVLVHALHVQLWLAQRQISNDSLQLSSHSQPFATSGTSTPMSQIDWVTRSVDPAGSGASSNNTSGRVTPVETDGHQLLKRVNHAFDKWKKVWDKDMEVQYPPSSTGYRRFGFCRDGAHFYYLAKYLMQNGYDRRMPPDQRCTQIFTLLKSAKNHVVSDSAKRGEELGSVSDIDKDYGVTNLTLDMAKLFKPINKQIDSPVAGVHTHQV